MQIMRIKMKKSVLIISFSIFMTIFMSNNLMAQQDHRISRDFNELKAYLLKIWVVVQRFDNVQAHQLMAQAKEELDLAEDLIFNQRKYVFARVHMVKARSLANQAAKIVLNQPVNRLKKQLDDLIIKAEQLYSNKRSEEGLYLLNQAKKYRRLAYDALSDGTLNKAQEFYRIAFYFADKSLNFANRKNIDKDTQIFELKSNIDLLFIQIEQLNINDNSNQLNSMINEARKHYAEALNLIETDRIDLALKRMRLIEKLLNRIIDQADRTSVNQKERIEKNLYSLRALLDALEANAMDNSNKRIQVFINRAKKQFADANTAYESGNFELAKNKINLCQRLASKALQLTKNSSEQDIYDLELQLEDNKQLLKFQQTKVESSNDKSLKRMFIQAEKLTNKAAQLNDQNQKKLAIQNLQLATRLMNQIQRRLKFSANEDNLSKNEIKSKMDRAESLIIKLKNNSNIQNEIKQLENLLIQAQNQYEQENYEIADEYLNYILQQINIQSKEWSKQTK